MENGIGYYIGYLIGVLIWAFIWGFVTKKVGESKDYDDCFWWGFWLGFIGLIVVMCKPDNYAKILTRKYNTEKNDYDARLSALANESGTPKSNHVHSAPAPVQLPPPTEAEQIAKYKKMCDDGLITPEEFDAKRKQILGL